MDVQHPKCAGLDVHQHTVVACARLVAGSTVRHERRTFGTTTADLLALSDWLTAHDCTHVAMESTGVYWKPIWQVLEGQFTLVLANAMHIRNIPGRKSDVNDATWIADLLAHGLIRGRRSAIQVASFTSLLRPGMLRMCMALARTRVNWPSRTCPIGFQYTPVDSMATCVQSWAVSQSLSANRSAVVVPNVRRSCRTVEPATRRAQATTVC